MNRMIVSVLMAAGMSAGAQAQEIEPFLRGFADKIINESKISFINQESGEAVEVSGDAAPRRGLTVGSPCANWAYTSALLSDGFYALANELNDDAYAQYVQKNHQFLFDHMDFIKRSNAKKKTRIGGASSLGRFGGIWTCGSQGGAVLNSYAVNNDPAYLEFGKEVAVHLEGLWERDHTGRKMERKALDGVYAYVATLARLGRLTGEPRYFDLCVEIVKETELCYDPAVKLYAQAYFPDMKITNNMFWLRGMGWTAMGFVELLSCLPKDHPGYDDVLAMYQKLMVGIAPYQTADGLWRHLVNRADCFEETSGSTFVVYAFAKGLNEGWLPERYRDVAMSGWRGIMSRMAEEGSIEGNTGSTRTSTSAVYYLNNSTKKTDAYLSGPLFLAGVEMMKLYKNPAYLKPYASKWNFTRDPAALNEPTN